jgi:hypothetical protein
VNLKNKTNKYKEKTTRKEADKYKIIEGQETCQELNMRRNLKEYRN